MDEKIEITNTAMISLKRFDLIKIKIKPNVTIDVEDALDNLLVIKNLSGGNKTYKLIDIRGQWKITKKAREVAKKNSSPENTLARAYIIDNLVSKMVLQFFKSFQSQDIPEKYFISEIEALKWLTQLKQ